MNNRILMVVTVMGIIFGISIVLPASSVSGDEEAQPLEKSVVDKKDPAEPTVSVGKPPVLDRRWILNMKNMDKQKPPEKGVPIEWESKDQQIRCDTYMNQIHQVYRKVKFFSISGDACNTARYAREFLQLIDMCENGCPEGFVLRKGYKDVLIKNVATLQELGKKQCLVKAPPLPGGGTTKGPE